VINIPAINVASFRTKVKALSIRVKNNLLVSPIDIEYLFVSIYRINFTNPNRTKLMKDIIYHLDNDNNNMTDIKPVARFSTLYNNRILGLEIQNASIYGQKIEMAFDDFDRELAKNIRKNDIIIIHRINSKKLKIADAIATLVGLSTYFPSGIKESELKIPLMSQSIKEKLTNSIQNKADVLADKFLMREKPMFSGIITLPQSVMGNSIKLTIEAQDMIRIMQHINTEEHVTSEVKGLPKDLDNFFLNVSEDMKVKGDDHLNILHSTILKTLGSAVYDEILLNDNAEEANNKNIIFIRNDSPLSDTSTPLIDSHDLIILRGISNGMFMVHISPLRALKLFVKYYAKNTGINTFFDFDMWDTDDKNFSDKTVVENIFKNIYKDQIGINPYFTFGIILEYEGNDTDIISYANDKLNNNTDIFNLFIESKLRNIFSVKTFDNIFKNRISETIITKYINNKNRATDDKDAGLWLLSEFFMHLVNPTSVDIGTDKVTGTLPNGAELFLNNVEDEKSSYVISKEARHLFHENLNKMKTDFSDSISLDYVVSTNFSSVRSTEFNPTLTNQMKSVPIIQIMQLFLGAMTVIPISQSDKTTGFDNTAYNISQRIWLSSAIGFRHPVTGVQSWIHKNGMKPVIFFGLNYKEGLIERTGLRKMTYMSDKDIINSKMFTLPSVGSLAVYQWGAESIHIGYSKYNEGDIIYGDAGTQLSMGGSMIFDLFNLAGKSDDYVSENIDEQTGGHRQTVFRSIPRTALFKLEDAINDNEEEVKATDALDIYNNFKGQLPSSPVNNFWVYVGHTMYGISGDDVGIKLSGNTKVKLYAPVMWDGTAKLEDLGANIFRANVSGANIAQTWKNLPGDFPTNKKSKIGIGDDRMIVTGIRDYYDPTKFLPILKSFQHFIKFGFTGVNGEGDKNLYTDPNLFSMFTNIFFKSGSDYLETYSFKEAGKELKRFSLSDFVNHTVEWIEDRFVGDDNKKRRMMLKYARNISVLHVNEMNGEDAPFRSDSMFHVPSLFSAIKSHTIAGSDGEKTIHILSSFVRSISHYMNRVAKESTTGGVIYCPFKSRLDGTIFEIGDAISFRKVASFVGNEFERFAKKLLLTKNKERTNLDIYEKIYYIWKITYYFGGAGTDPSGSSGSTMRIYLTDSGIHWNSSYEEKDITTRIAESMMLNRLAVKF